MADGLPPRARLDHVGAEPHPDEVEQQGLHRHSFDAAVTRGTPLDLTDGGSQTLADAR